jgi:hypothetical protein
MMSLTFIIFPAPLLIRPAPNVGDRAYNHFFHLKYR